MNKYYILGLIAVIVLPVTVFSIGTKTHAFDFAAACWQKTNGRYSFGDANKDYPTIRDCAAGYAYYLVVKQGAAVDCIATTLDDGKHHSDGYTFDTTAQCTAYLMTKYNMTETRPSASISKAPTCNYSNESASWRSNLQTKITALYAELLKRTANANDFAYWQSATPFSSCGQTINEASIRTFIQASDEYKNLQTTPSAIQPAITNQSIEAQPVTKTEAPKTGFLNYLKFISSRIVSFFKRLF